MPLYLLDYVPYFYSRFSIICVVSISFLLVKIVIKYCPAARSKSEITCWSVENDFNVFPFRSTTIMVLLPTKGIVMKSFVGLGKIKKLSTAFVSAMLDVEPFLIAFLVIAFVEPMSSRIK